MWGALHFMQNYIYIYMRNHLWQTCSTYNGIYTHSFTFRHIYIYMCQRTAFCHFSDDAPCHAEFDSSSGSDLAQIANAGKCWFAANTQRHIRYTLWVSEWVREGAHFLGRNPMRSQGSLKSVRRTSTSANGSRCGCWTMFSKRCYIYIVEMKQ